MELHLRFPNGNGPRVVVRVVSEETWITITLVLCVCGLRHHNSAPFNTHNNEPYEVTQNETLTCYIEIGFAYNPRLLAG